MKSIKDICYRYPRITHWIICLICFVIMVLTSSCAKKVEYITQYQEVKVPIKCEFEIPDRPLDSGDIVINTSNLLSYTERLEVVLRKCKDVTK